MNEAIKEWITRAGHDYEVALLLDKEESECYEIICFHCQQYVEKMLKAILLKEDIVFPKIHDLIILLNKLPDNYKQLKKFSSEILILNEYAVSSRYPGEIVDIDDAKESIDIILGFKALISDIL